jgi:chromosomal replication initiator protein
VGAVSDMLKTRHIINVATQLFEVSRDNLLGAYRGRSVYRYRAATIYVVKLLVGSSYPELGDIFDKDHTTIMHAIRRCEQDQHIGELIEELLEELEGANVSSSV